MREFSLKTKMYLVVGAALLLIFVGIKYGNFYNALKFAALWLVVWPIVYVLEDMLKDPSLRPGKIESRLVDSAARDEYQKVRQAKYDAECEAWQQRYNSK